MTRKISFPDARILIVDDNRVNLKVSKVLLEAFKCEVVVVMSGVEALELIDKGEEFDIIFMDLLMPVIDGAETAVKIRQKEGYENTKIIALSGAQVTENSNKYLEARFDDFLPKPLVVEALSNTLEKFMPELCHVDSEATDVKTKRGKRLETFSATDGCEKLWNDEKIYSEYLTLYLQKSIELMHTVIRNENSNVRIDALEDLLSYGKVAGTLKLNKMLSELIVLLKINEDNLALSKLSAVDEEYNNAINEINKYLSRSTLQDVLTFG